MEPEARSSPAAGPPLLVVPPEVPPLFFDDLVDFLVEVLVPDVPLPVPVADFLLLPVCALLSVVVVVAVSFVFVHAVTNAKPTTAVRVRRRDFFIGVGVSACNSYSAATPTSPLLSRPVAQNAPRGAPPGREPAVGPQPYSARRATIGFTRVARRAGTKHDNAATAVSSAVTAR